MRQVAEQRKRRLSAARASALLDASIRSHRIAVREEVRNAPPSKADQRRAGKTAQRPHTERDHLVGPAEVYLPNDDRLGTLNRVSVNRRVDTLGHELAQRRITREEFTTGRLLQAVWTNEEDQGPRGSTWTGSVSGMLDGLTKPELAAIRLLVQAREIEAWNARVRTSVGDEGLALLRSVLCGHGYFADIARNEGRTGDRAAAQVAGLFRWMLCKVTNALQTATGPETGRIR